MKNHAKRLLKAENKRKEKMEIQSEEGEEGLDQRSIPLEDLHSSPSHKKSDEFVCSNKKCGKAVVEPFKIIDLSEGTKENVLHVCPHCLSRLEDVPSKVTTPSSPVNEPSQAAEGLKGAAENEGSGPKGCPQFLGYLGKRPKDKPIPDECLMCSEAVRCMLG
ncbi:MAG: hypothetical protein JSV58_03575 [Candidatus Bathyarchaeota archaeon]|nr:MAG: hypothetical protein JSV58_03575 [Candidatus Bathyarchaeota archaeon]